MKKPYVEMMIARNLEAGIPPESGQHPYPTPSPFSSSHWGSRTSIYHVSGLVLRSSVLLFSFASVVSLATQSHKAKRQKSNTFTDYSELLIVQLLKTICDISPTGSLISNKISDYASFICDQLISYFLISSSTMMIPLITRMKHDGTLWKAAAIAASMSLVSFVVMAICAVLSGYKLCKRIIW
ncbi:hypothetical protein ACFE04_014048 [Oxalis oulophora]